jgi:hypothetical protein
VFLFTAAFNMPRAAKLGQQSQIIEKLALIITPVKSFANHGMTVDLGCKST